MSHAKCTGGVLVIVCEALGEKELHDGGARIGFHPDERSQPVPVDTHQDLAFHPFNLLKYSIQEDAPSSGRLIGSGLHATYSQPLPH